MPHCQFVPSLSTLEWSDVIPSLAAAPRVLLGTLDLPCCSTADHRISGKMACYESIVEVSDDKNMSMFPYPGLHVCLGVTRAEDFVVLCHED